MESDQLLFAIVFVIGMFAGVLVIFLAMRQRAMQLEMVHRERMAMIEKGQVPLDPVRPGSGSPGGNVAGLRSITLGIVVIAIGLGLMSIVGIAADEPSIGIGIGGAIVILGIGFIASGLLRRNQGNISS
jgi:hypothetical protein